jgi:hypothetical protein
MNNIIGLAVMFDRPCDRVDLCCAKNRLGKIGPDNALFCGNCGAARGRLPENVIRQIADIMARFGLISDPIVLRAGGRQ